MEAWNIMVRTTLALLLLAAGCGEGDGTQTQEGEQQDTAFDESDDNIGPEIDHAGVESPQPSSAYLNVTATITDESQVLSGTIWYRRQTSTDWKSIAMSSSGADQYLGVIPPEELYSAGMHYYIEASDVFGNTSTSPDAAPTDYLKFDLVE
jgi:hypothetical protein